MNRPSLFLTTALGLSGVLSVYAAVLGYKETAVGEHLSDLWMVVFALLVAFWAHADAGTQKVHRSLDFPFYFLVLWPLTLPYYLVKTRGTEGVVYFLGFAAIYSAPFLFGLIAYTYLVAE